MGTGSYFHLVHDHDILIKKEIITVPSYLCYWYLSTRNKTTVQPWSRKTIKFLREAILRSSLSHNFQKIFWMQTIFHFLTRLSCSAVTSGYLHSSASLSKALGVVLIPACSILIYAIPVQVPYCNTSKCLWIVPTYFTPCLNQNNHQL